jgi:hypothetical protein
VGRRRTPRFFLAILWQPSENRQRKAAHHFHEALNLFPDEIMNETVSVPSS